MKPFQQVKHIHNYKRRLNMSVAGANSSGKIWYFVADKIEVEVVLDSDQEIILKLSFLENNTSMITTLVYAKCNERQSL